MQKRIIALLCSIPLIISIPLSLQLRFEGVYNRNEKSELQLLYANKYNLDEDMVNKVKEENKKFWDEKLKLMKQEDDIIKAKELKRKKEAEEELLNKNKKVIPEDKIKTREIQVDNKINVTWEVSHYCSCSICSGNWGTQTAMGTTTTRGVVAVPKEIPLGSKIYIDGLGTFRAEDRGGNIKKVGSVYRVDVYVNSHQEAMRLGRYKATGYYISNK